MSSKLEDRKFIQKDQAGFRVGEEATGQFVTFAEIVRQCIIHNKKTYAVFLDFGDILIATDIPPNSSLLSYPLYILSHTIVTLAEKVCREAPELSLGNTGKVDDLVRTELSLGNTVLTKSSTSTATTASGT